jgi:O-antigen ligase
LSAASSDLEPQAWDGWIAFAKVAVIAVLVVAHVDSPRRFEAVLWVIAGSMSILALSTVVRGVAIGYPGTFTNTLGGLGAPVGPTGEGAMRDNNAFARVLVLSLPLCWILARQARRRSAKLLALLCGAVIVSGLVMTFSRTGGIAAAVVGAAALLWVRPRWKAVAVLLVVATLAFALAPEQYRGRLQSVSPDDWSLKLRYRIWARGLEMTKARPLLGVGIGTFTEHYARMAPPPKRSAHNVFIEVLAEMGVLGLLSYLALLAMVLWRLSRLAAARSEWTRVVARGLLLGLLGFLIMSTTLSHALSSHLVAGLALAFALMSAAGRSAATARSEEASLRAHGTSIEALG